MERFLGIDVGAETIKVVELVRDDDRLLRVGHRLLVDHAKTPGPALLTLLQVQDWLDWPSLQGAAVGGRLHRTVRLPQVPDKQARAAAFRFLHPDGGPATLVTIGSHGYAVLELRGEGLEVQRENSRCSQGTGNFLRQLVGRFELELAEADRLCAPVTDPAPLSGRCPVILKTDMTHLANHGQSRERILAGLYDAVAENVQVLLKPRVSPPRVALYGGVSRGPRIRDHFSRFLARHGMELLPWSEEEALFLEAIGCALHAAEQPVRPPALADLVQLAPAAPLERLAPLHELLPRVRHLTAPPLPLPDGNAPYLLLGLDIGSTGSKAVAFDVLRQAPVWQGYLRTGGDPVAAARALVRQFQDGPWGGFPLHGVGVTGSGREIVGSLLRCCYGSGPIFVLNEIAAHAAGAVHYEPRVDTIFEIGGQDAKYIRLDQGRVVDAAMNEACSAGTGSFIEEQGRRFAGIPDVIRLGEVALAAPAAISLGQHCSVFMAEIIDEAVAAGEPQPAIVAGIYDAIIQNYLNRVKGNRSVGQVIFCQGMPFAADALAAAVARQTGAEVIIPPDPGTIGALGIALLAQEELVRRDPASPRPPTGLELERFLAAEVLQRDQFTCRSTQGCGGQGARCRIDRLTVQVAGQQLRFTWGGGCALHDRGTGRAKLPDRTPDPFREREELIDTLLARLGPARGLPRIALTDEFSLKTLFPFIATFLHRLGFDLVVQRGADQTLLKRGIEEANVPFCAPMQQYHGIVSHLGELTAEHLLLPMVRALPRVEDEPRAVLCPIVQASPDLLRWDLPAEVAARIVSPVLDMGPEGLRSAAFQASCAALARSLGRGEGHAWEDAFALGLAAQEQFEQDCLGLGQRALACAADQGLTPVVILGRPYTIYNRVLNSNVPAILREQGALPIPVDCYPVAETVPVLPDMYWAYGQRSLRAAHQIRRTPGIYALWCSNYSCGPDSFGLHFFSYLMEGKPAAVIETDGHSGDAGTKTRVEAFLYCVREDLRAGRTARPNSLLLLALERDGLPDIRRRRERVLIPRMGPGAEVFAACLRGLGVAAEALPLPDRDALRLGRRYTTGKECLPMTITLGSLLQRLEPERNSEELFSFFMPTAKGPCRFGVYNLLHKICLERLGWGDRVRVWSPADSGYFDDVPIGFGVLVYCGFVAADLLLEAWYDTRPAERTPGVAQRIHEQATRELSALLRQAAGGDLGVQRALAEVATGRLFGVAELLRRYAAAFAAEKLPGERPTVLVVGEIYVRCDPFANDFTIDRLQEQGVRVRFAPFTEWLEYTDHLNACRNPDHGLDDWLSARVQSRIRNLSHGILAAHLGWPARTTVLESLAASADYLRDALDGEAVLTLGGPLHEWREGLIDGALSLGPLECLPSKIAEAQFVHAAEREGLPSLTLALNGDPVDPELLAGFLFEVQARFRRRMARRNGQLTLLHRSRRAMTLLGRKLDRDLPTLLPSPARRVYRSLLRNED